MGMITQHSHSGEFCLHAKGTLEEVAQEAIAQGFTTFGLSEHVPRYKREHLYPEESHLRVEELQSTFARYLDEAWRLKKAYADRITLLVGLETEYIDEAGLDELERLIERERTRVQYLVGSVHHCHELPIDFDKPGFDQALASSSGSDDRARFASLFEAYFDAQHALMSRLEPAVIGHFDLCRLYYPDLDLRQSGVVWAKIERNVRLGVSYGALFEVNAAAFRKGWRTAYPGAEVLELILREGGRLTLSDDSHGPLAVGAHYEDAFGYLEAQGVEQLWRLKETGEGLKPEPVPGKPWLGEWQEQRRRRFA